MYVCVRAEGALLLRSLLAVIPGHSKL